MARNDESMGHKRISREGRSAADSGILRTCVYCLQHKRYSRKKNGTSEFSKEHVIHQAFTYGFNDNLTLLDRVCQSCNDEFGRTIDSFLARRSLEAWLRYKAGAKDLNRLSELNLRESIKVFSPNPAYDQARIELNSDDNGNLCYRFATQLAYRHTHSETWSHLTLNEIRSKPRDWLEVGMEVLLISEDDTGERELLAALDGFGVNVETAGFQVAGEFKVGVPITMDTLYQRAISKIAFNYLAKVTERSLPHYIFSPELEEIRCFIRYGEPHAKTYVQLLEESGDGREGAKEHHHLLSFEEVTMNGLVHLLAVVQLFGGMKWQVNLARDFKGIQTGYAARHVWSREKMRVEAIANGTSYQRVLKIGRKA